VKHHSIDDLMQHAGTLYRYALTRVKDHHTAEDLVQDCLSAAWQRIDSFDARSALHTWLIGIMKFKVIDHYRKSKRTPTDQTTDPAENHDPLDRVFDSQGSWNLIQTMDWSR
jgi:RNA polymerase sigma-70 factor, ECF subfamily